MKDTATEVEYQGHKITIIADPDGLFAAYFGVETPQQACGELVPEMYLSTDVLVCVEGIGRRPLPRMLFTNHLKSPEQLQQAEALKLYVEKQLQQILWHYEQGPQ